MGGALATAAVVLGAALLRLWATRPRSEPLTRESAAWELLCDDQALGTGEPVMDFTHKAGRA